MEFKVIEAVRIAVGSLDGRKSSPWRFWGDKKGDVYASARSMGGIFKISLHKDGKCFASLTSEYKSKHPNSLLDKSRHFDEWELNTNAPEMAIQILFPESELREYQPKNLENLTWFSAPQKNHMFVTTIYILPTSIKEVSFDSNKKMFPIASFETAIRNALIVAHYQELDLPTITWIEEQRKHFANHFKVSQTNGYRAIVAGSEIKKNRRWFLDMAL